MSPLRDALVDYLTTRRSLGFELRLPGKNLENFVCFVERHKATVITTELSLRWAKLPNGVEPATWAERLDLVRRFARYCSALDPRTEIPPEGLLPDRRRRKPPYIYTDKEIGQLLLASKALPSRHKLRPLTYETLVGLLAISGMRIGEALALDDTDVDLQNGILTIRDAKYGKTRYIPVHKSTRRALLFYANKRNHFVPRQQRPAYFVGEEGRRLSYSGVRWTFLRLLSDTKLDTKAGQRLPRIHDLRHTFAVRTLIRWYQTGIDVEANLPRLATYLGHTHVTDTYWYLSAVPQLLRLVVRRVEQVHKRQKK